MDPILEAFDRTCHDHGSRLALWSRGERVRRSFAELAAASAAWSARLAGLGDRAGEGEEAVALATGNGAAFVELFFALRRLGRPVALVDGGLAADAKVQLCRRLGLSLLLHREESLAGDDLGQGVVLTRLAGLEPVAAPPGTALVKLTSGSTGDPVGICLDAAALAAGIRQIGEGMGITARDTVLIAIPLSHSYGFDNGVLSLAALGTPLVLEPGYYPTPLLNALQESAATFFPAVPPMVRALADSEWPEGLALRRVISAGGPLAPEFAARFHARSGRPVHQFYGSTETGGLCFESEPLAPAALGTVGFPLPGVAIHLGDDGTVAVDSAASFSTYLGGKPGDGRRVILGDRGEWTAEGRLRLTGRAADLLNVGGRRVSTAAVESSLRALPGVRDVAVIGVADAVRGDRVVAFLVGCPHPEHPGRLPAGLAARDLRYLEALPYTDRGKLDRARLRQWVNER